MFLFTCWRFYRHIHELEAISEYVTERDNHIASICSPCLWQYKWILSLFLLGEIILVVFIFVFYFVPNAKETLGLFPSETFKDAVKKYGIVEDDDMKNFIDNMQKSVCICFPSVSSLVFLNLLGNVFQSVWWQKRTQYLSKLFSVKIYSVWQAAFKEACGFM